MDSTTATSPYLHLRIYHRSPTRIWKIQHCYIIAADCLSRATLNSVVLGIDYAAMACAQADDPNVKAFPTSITSLQIQPFQIDNSTTPLLCDVSTSHPRPLVPNSFQRQVFEAIHNLAHPGRKSTVRLVSQKFVWHGLKKQVSSGRRNVLHAKRPRYSHMYIHR